MYHNQSSPYERLPGSDRHEGWQPVTDGQDPLLTEPTRLHRTVDPEPALGSGGFPSAPAEATRLYPAIGTSGGPSGGDHLARPVSPAEPMSSGQHHTDAVAGASRGHFGTGAGEPRYRTDYAAGPGAAQAGYPAGTAYTPGTAQVGYRGGAGTVRSSTARSRSTGRGLGSALRRVIPGELRIGLGTALTAAGALLVVLGSFAPFIRYDNPGGVQRLAGKRVSVWFSAWSPETFLAPLTWWPILAGLALLAIVAVRLGGLSEDREFLGFRLSHIQVTLSLVGFLVLFGYAVSSKSLVFGSQVQDAVTAKFMAGDISVGWGGHLMLLGSLATVVGAFLDHLGIGPTVWPPSSGSDGYQPRRGQNRPSHGYEQAPGGYQQSGHRQAAHYPAHQPAHQPAPHQQQTGHYGM